MKVPPKRKGNTAEFFTPIPTKPTLNESPSEKEGKCQQKIADEMTAQGPQ